VFSLIPIGSIRANQDTDQRASNAPDASRMTDKPTDELIHMANAVRFTDHPADGKGEDEFFAGLGVSIRVDTPTTSRSGS
jgi:hypothetical protein